MRAILLIFASVFLMFCPTTSVAQSSQCRGDFNGNGQVTVDEILTSVNNALNGCPPPGARFVDNGDGTITDTKTALMWEKKSDDSGIHDQDDTYTWSSSGSPANGTTFTTFLATLNQNSFAGHQDWRLPSAAELQTLLDYTAFAPAIDAAFNAGCDVDCALTTCSCTGLGYYWSSTTIADQPDLALSVDFNYGLANLFEKTLPAGYVRAVRGGQ